MPISSKIWRTRQRLAKLTSVERRVGVSPSEGSERDDWPVMDAGREQAVKFGEAAADVFGHGRRLGLAVLDVKLLPFPLTGSSLPLLVTRSLGGLADLSRLSPLEFAGFLLADTLLPRTLPLYLCPQPLPLRHADPCHGYARAPCAGP
jgi:hypothetical protein